MHHLDKQKLRQHFKAWRQALPEDVQWQAAQKLLPYFWERCHIDGDIEPSHLYIGFYTAIGGEVSTDCLLQDCLQRGAHCFLPVISEDSDDKLLQYREVFHDSELIASAWGTKIPKVGVTQRANTLTHMLVPALAVTKQGARLGFGAGYFDATIHEARSQHAAPPSCWGVVYQAQCVDELPQAPWDECLDAVICV